MKVTYQTVVKDDKVVQEKHLEDICCKGMWDALLKQETPFPNEAAASLWLFCPFCKTEIEYI